MQVIGSLTGDRWVQARLPSSRLELSGTESFDPTCCMATSEADPDAPNVSHRTRAQRAIRQGGSKMIEVPHPAATLRPAQNHASQSANSSKIVQSPRGASQVRMHLGEVAHERRQPGCLPNGDAVVEARAQVPWSAEGRDGAQPDHASLPRLDEEVLGHRLVAAADVEWDVHPAPRGDVGGSGVEAAAVFDGLVDQLAFLDGAPLHLLYAALPLDPLHHEAHDLDVEGRRRVPDVARGRVHRVVEDAGAERRRSTEEVAADDDDGDAGVADVLRRASEEDADVVADPIHGLAGEIRARVDDEGHPPAESGRQLRQPVQLHAVHRLVGTHIHIPAPGCDVALDQLREAPVVRRRLIHHMHVAVFGGLRASALRPIAADDIGRDLGAVRTQVQRHGRELPVATAVHKEHLVAGGDLHHAPERVPRVVEDAGELRRAMGHRHRREPLAREAASDLRLHSSGQGRRSWAEVREVFRVVQRGLQATQQRRMLQMLRAVAGERCRRLRQRASLIGALELHILADAEGPADHDLAWASALATSADMSNLGGGHA
eukprot:CAMPEP_0176099554 /NCGR_PEP_ID=MMETSP0120_2-20121206/49926_1 /TAXON_ID=160619 /ORGANISM="Kryptoperidinium foliaceum, Strain CCMP 1326" /LENGTH=546 /DNA_ID=CAMNT_0017433585 /DNA_START=8 /DNA_END=1646 /DNA_ORIENTATION=+